MKLKDKYPRLLCALMETLLFSSQTIHPFRSRALSTWSTCCRPHRFKIHAGIHCLDSPSRKECTASPVLVFQDSGGELTNAPPPCVARRNCRFQSHSQRAFQHATQAARHCARDKAPPSYKWPSNARQIAPPAPCLFILSRVRAGHLHSDQIRDVWNIFFWRERSTGTFFTIDAAKVCHCCSR